jgi:GAF domain
MAGHPSPVPGLRPGRRGSDHRYGGRLIIGDRPPWETMSNRWLAGAGADPQARAREIARAHSTFLTVGWPAAGAGPASLRDVVADSWRRSAAARVDPDTDPPVTLTGPDLAGYRTEHPLSGVVELLRDLVGAACEDGEHLWAVSDTSGRLMWVEGHRSARAQAERMHFVEGALWDEAHAGTNAPGTALATDHEVQIFATEHYRHTVQAWTCAAAPIHDPVSGQVLGAVDVTGGDVVAHPHSLALVRAAARAAEARLAALPRLENGLAGPPALWLPPPRDVPRLAALGRSEALLTLDGQDVRLNRRHSELMFLLASHPRGLTGDELATALYDDTASLTTVRVELTRLRRVVGGLLQSRPYRLTVPVAADYADVRAALQRGDVAAAVTAYQGPLLPRSQAPGIEVQRRWLEVQLRSAVLACPDPAVVRSWTERFGFDDLEPWERLAAMLPSGSGGRAAARARVRQLRAEYGLAGDATLR